MEIAMAEIKILINGTPLGGWTWQLVASGKALKSGTARTGADARAAADAALRELQKAQTANGTKKQ
jgi:hypothetical protein